ncbi:M23 family metallopeptidase [Streptomyces sp. NPDC051940]|uniref:M23 family metallopeptidase n=1 Tax=Streptomyces sp. NPDC051940 TaxID=3155675 RepID=UPI00343912B7
MVRALPAAVLPLLLAAALPAPVAMAADPGPGEGAGSSAGRHAGDWAPGTADDRQPGLRAPAAPDALRGPRPVVGWATPLLRGARISAAYGIPGKLWAAGHHTGVDLAVPSGTRVRSVGPGRVIEAGWHNAYGNYAKIRMDDGHYVLYGHLSRLRTVDGERVYGGELIGLSGATGNATGPHLHFEVRRGRVYGTDVDPIRYLARYRVRL